MKIATRVATLVAGATMGAALLGSGTAAAAFPNYSDCPRAASDYCLNIQARSGNMVIKGFNVPLGESLEIRGGLRQNAEVYTFVPPVGKTGVFGRPAQVPGGLLGIDFPLPGNAVTATATLAGPTSAVRISPAELRVSLPLKLKLDNPIIGPGCQIGSNSNPINVDLIVGTTNPPAPNRPITGRAGELTINDDGSIIYAGNVNVDNAFAISGANSCGLHLGLINSLVNAKLGLPSAAGNNSLTVVNDVALSGA